MINFADRKINKAYDHMTVLFYCKLIDVDHQIFSTARPSQVRKLGQHREITRCHMIYVNHIMKCKS